jgi:PEP-CTERM motif
MNTVKISLMAVAVALCALVVSPGIARADTLTGSTDISWLYPDTGTAIGSDTIAVGSTLACPGASPICAPYLGYGTETFSVGTSSISYSALFPPATYGGTSFDGFDFTGLTFADGGSLTGFTLTTNIPGLTDSDVTFGSNFIEVNLAGLSVNGDFTLDLISSPTVSTPEPSSFLLLGIGLLALVGFTRRKRAQATLSL